MYYWILNLIGYMMNQSSDAVLVAQERGERRESRSLWLTQLSIKWLPSQDVWCRGIMLLLWNKRNSPTIKSIKKHLNHSILPFCLHSMMEYCVSTKYATEMDLVDIWAGVVPRLGNMGSCPGWHENSKKKKITFGPLLSLLVAG